ncbi:MAG: hypothetical protein IPP03_16365 [Dechloromonas sp.]|jgi:hypothetical protein|nr:hypothetical protein [Candidatus Dechloromonas phosphoritropha]MBP8787143.1 hypothetical protein [Azonexus sp.]MBP9227284.1 hypothetical protein [Azonexus sp.]
MNDQNPENPPVVPPPAPPPNDNRRRLRELLAISERDRTDEQWDEIIELEIQLAPGNRASTSDLGSAQNLGGGQNKPPGQPKKHRPRTISNNRRPRPNKPTGSQV